MQFVRNFCCTLETFVIQIFALMEYSSKQALVQTIVIIYMHVYIWFTHNLFNCTYQFYIYIYIFANKIYKLVMHCVLLIKLIICGCIIYPIQSMSIS